MAKPFKGQKFSKIRNNQLKLGIPFSDPLFPATDASLFLSRKKINGKIEWKRPQEICANPTLFDEGISSGDVFQGQLGNCWFVAACSVLAGVKQLWHKVIPDYKDQDWDKNHPESHPGVFRFCFWRFGQWIEVVIDDKLPTVNGRLIFTHSKSRNEFWCALLEKAYAKVNGCYEALDGGRLADALVDFTSGISENIELKEGNFSKEEEKRKLLFKSLLKHKENHALLCCSLAAANANEMEQRTSVGLIKGHAYSITAIRRVNLKDTRLFAFLRGKEKINMIRLRNPWGEKEWTGSFSDGDNVGLEGEGAVYAYSAADLTRIHSRSPEWQRISSSEREKLGLNFEDDGEFWMTFDDFVLHFTEVSVCHLLNTSIFTFSRRWQGLSLYGNWTTGPRGSAADRAGGCANNKDTFLRNPQYCFDIESDDDEIVVQLMQREVRDRKREGAEYLVIGMDVLRVEENREYRIHSFAERAAHSDYSRVRSVILRQQMAKGRYLLVPTTFAPGQTGEYLLRFYATCDARLRELKRDVPKPSICPCVSYPACVTSVKIMKFTGLTATDPYCIVKCEGQSARSPVYKEANENTWKFSTVFYRKRPNKPITIEIWNRNVILDKFVGHMTVAAPCEGRKSLVTSLRGKRDADDVPGKIFLEYVSHDDLQAL